MGFGNVMSFLGIFVLVFFAWLISRDRKTVNWKVLQWGLLMQVAFGAFVFLFPPGRLFFQKLNGLVLHVLGYAGAGTNFVFGPLAAGPGQKGSVGFILAFQVLPAVLVFAALMGLLYHIGVMQLLIRAFSFVFTKLFRISGAEALCASSNIFVGVEASLTIRPYINRMTQSELCTILAAGMATVASTVLGLYSFFLYKQFPGIAGHLISASILSAPAVLVMTKLLVPETGQPETLGRVVEPKFDKAGNWIEAVIRSSNEGVRLAVGIGATLVVFVSLLKMANAFVGWSADAVLGQATVIKLFGVKTLTIQSILGAAFYPFVRIMGVSGADAGLVADLLGKRVVLTELPCYQDLAVLMAQQKFQDPRSVVIATYALCGFAHIPSIAIFVGGFAAVEPRRAKDLGAMAFRALLGATMACLMTGALAGAFYTGKDKVILGAPKAAKKAAPAKAGTKNKTAKSSVKTTKSQKQKAKAAPNNRAKVAPANRDAKKPAKRAKAVPTRKAVVKREAAKTKVPPKTRERVPAKAPAKRTQTQPKEKPTSRKAP